MSKAVKSTIIVLIMMMTYDVRGSQHCEVEDHQWNRTDSTAPCGGNYMGAAVVGIFGSTTIWKCEICHQGPQTRWSWWRLWWVEEKAYRCNRPSPIAKCASCGLEASGSLFHRLLIEKGRRMEYLLRRAKSNEEEENHDTKK